MQSDFTLTVQDANKKKQSEKGVMYFNNSKKQYAIKLNDQEVISDGKTVWNISKELKEVQITDADVNSNEIGPSNLFTFYQKGYKYVMMNDEKIEELGKKETVKVIELSPLTNKTNYFKIIIRVNKNYHIHDVSILDKSNNRFTYTVNTMYLGRNLSNSYFTFNKNNYPGYEIVDLR